jgi:hypothetical protein
MKALAKMQEFGRVILEAYRNKKFNFDSDTHEKTIMSHIMKHDYPSEDHRISDILVFLVAGIPPPPPPPPPSGALVISILFSFC